LFWVVGWRSWGNRAKSMTRTMRRITNNASKTSRSVMTSARKSNGKVIGRRRGIDARAVRIERGVPSTTIERLRYSLARIFEDRLVFLVMVF
jgi:hypothetical protein